MHSIVLDIETTGLSPTKNKIIELYALKLDDFWETIDTFYALIDIGEPLSDFISNLTGITDEKLREKGKSEQEVIKQFHNFIGNDLLVGHNIDRFDLPFLREAAKRWQLDINNKTFDTLLAARKTFHFDKYNLNELAKYLNIKSETFHNAKDDVLVTVELFKKLIEAHS